MNKLKYFLLIGFLPMPSTPVWTKSFISAWMSAPDAPRPDSSVESAKAVLNYFKELQ